MDYLRVKVGWEFCCLSRSLQIQIYSRSYLTRSESQQFYCYIYQQMRQSLVIVILNYYQGCYYERERRCCPYSTSLLLFVKGRLVCNWLLVLKQSNSFDDFFVNIDIASSSFSQLAFCLLLSSSTSFPLTKLSYPGCMVRLNFSDSHTF